MTTYEDPNSTSRFPAFTTWPNQYNLRPAYTLVLSNRAEPYREIKAVEYYPDGSLKRVEYQDRD